MEQKNVENRGNEYETDMNIDPKVITKKPAWLVVEEKLATGIPVNDYTPLFYLRVLADKQEFVQELVSREHSESEREFLLNVASYFDRLARPYRWNAGEESEMSEAIEARS